MSISFWVAEKTFNIGSPDLLHAFFSTITFHLEPNGWASRFPVLMDDLYSGKVSYEKIPRLKDELEEARIELARYPPSKVIWDIEDLSKQPPWRDEIAETTKSLADYFSNSLNSESLFDVLTRAIEYAQTEEADIEIA